ncbi:MAG TPA: MFS transporter [Candidatus Limnocylindria bacterium]|nr:MFS transporter [Candidatus Limnocylindria bacterium]
MRRPSSNGFRIEAVFAGVYSSFWMGYAPLAGFLAVYLTYHGISDTSIGVTASAIAMLTIGFQLAVSSFSDAHLSIPVKRIILAVYFTILALVTLLALIPLPVALMLVVFALALSLSNTMPGLINAQILQFINSGQRVNIGWPRGTASIAYAFTAFYIGRLVENYSPSILMPLCLVITVFGVIIALMMPVPSRDEDEGAIPALAEPIRKTSLRQMLAASPVLQLFLLSVIFMSAGQSNVALFINRVVEHVGGNRADLGLAMAIQAGVEMPAFFLTPFLLRRFRARAILVLALSAYLAKFTILYFAGSLGGVYTAMAVSILAFGLFGVTSVYFVNDMVRVNEKVRAQALVAVSGSLAAIVNNLTSGWIVDNWGIERLNLVCMLLQAVAFTLMAACAWMQAKSEKRPMRPTPKPAAPARENNAARDKNA